MNSLVPFNNVNLSQTLQGSLQSVDYFIRRSYLADLPGCPVKPSEIKDTKLLRLFHIDKIIYDEQEDINEKLSNIYSALQNIGAAAILLIKGSAKRMEYYIGARGSEAASIPANLLQNSFSANFPGSVLENKYDDEIQDILNNIHYDNICSVTVVPSTREENEKKYIQGMEKLIDTMQGKEFSALFISTPLKQSDISARKAGMEQLYTAISPYAKSTLAYGENESEAISEGTFENFTESLNNSISKTLGTSVTLTDSSSTTWLSSFTSGYSVSHGTSESETESSGSSTAEGRGTNRNETRTYGTNQTITIESVNKSVDNILSYIDDQFEKLKSYDSFGAWETAAYFCSGQIENSIIAASTFKGLVSGDETGIENAYINVWDIQNRNTPEVAKYLKVGHHPQFVIPGSKFVNNQIVTPGNYVSGKDLPVFMGLPQKSVSGLTVSTMAEFSRNVSYRDHAGKKNARQIDLGCIHHIGKDEIRNRVSLDLDSFTSHCFVTGSTGSGKSNTTYCLLQECHENKIPFLVIEPAKGEYKEAFGKIPGIRIFTSNPYMGTLLKLNPFEFHPNIHILEHLDRLIEIFNACWEMYAAMPAILKSAVEKAYINKGWDLLNSIYLYDGAPQFPTFDDLLATLPQIIRNTAYSSDSQGDYTGALVTRVESLTKGITGQIFCDNDSIEDEILFEKTAVVDLSRIGSTETKALIMGILVMRLTEYRMATAKGSNLELRHVTVLEEAHNLLKNVSQVQGQESANPIGKSVEMICNSIAEMRTYGEGFIIVDQSPSSVDIAAIKNTNTKIVMRLPEKHDCEAIGNSLGLNENQIKELSKLPVGVGAVMQNNWLEAVLCKVNAAEERFRKAPESCTYAQRKEIRSTAISGLLTQYSKHSVPDFDFNAIERSVNAVSAPDFLKEEALAKVRRIWTDYSVRQTGFLAFASAVYAYSGAASVFQVNEPQILGKEIDVEALSRWRSAMMLRLKKVLSLDYEDNYAYVLQLLTFALAYKPGAAVDYLALYMSLFKNKKS